MKLLNLLKTKIKLQAIKLKNALNKDSSIMAMEHGSPMTKDEYEKAQKRYIKAKLYKLKHKIKKTQDIEEFKPEDKIFISGDGDGIGSKVEQKVMANDLEGLLAQSKKIEDGQIHVKTEFEKLGGKMLVSGGDDSLALISKEHIGKVEKIRQGYKDKTGGFTITFGVGNTMRDAVKALVYAKLTGKDRTEFWSADLNQKLEDISKPQSPKEKYEEHGLLPEDIGKCDDIRKYVIPDKDTQKGAHGWINPEGEYHHLKPHEEHGDWMTQHHDMTPKEAHNKDWLAIGAGGYHNVEGNEKVLSDSKHKATKTARKLAGKNFGPETELSYEDKDKIKTVGTRLWEKFGSYRGPIFKTDQKEHLSDQLKRIYNAVVAKGGYNKNKITDASEVFGYKDATDEKCCENCRFYTEKEGVCHLYVSFNDTEPELYGLDPKVDGPKVCNLHKEAEDVPNDERD